MEHCVGVVVVSEQFEGTQPFVTACVCVHVWVQNIAKLKVHLHAWVQLLGTSLFPYMCNWQRIIFMIMTNFHIKKAWMQHKSHLFTTVFFSQNTVIICKLALSLLQFFPFALIPENTLNVWLESTLLTMTLWTSGQRESHDKVSSIPQVLTTSLLASSLAIFP